MSFLIAYNNPVNAIQKNEPMRNNESPKYTTIEYLISDTTNIDDKIQIFELLVKELKLATLSNYAKTNNISYNGAKKFRRHIIIDNKKFIINDKL